MRRPVEPTPEFERLLGNEKLGTPEQMERMYVEMRAMADRMMQSERVHHTLQPTALVHEAFLRLADARNLDGKGRLHFLEAAAVTMRRVLIDHARGRDAAKRGGAWQRVTLNGIDENDEAEREIDLVRLEELLVELEELDPRQARIVELRFFGDLTGQEIADLLDVSRPTVVRELAMARAWLRRGLER